MEEMLSNKLVIMAKVVVDLKYSAHKGKTINNIMRRN